MFSYVFSDSTLQANTMQRLYIKVMVLLHLKRGLLFFFSPVHVGFFSHFCHHNIKFFILEFDFLLYFLIHTLQANYLASTEAKFYTAKDIRS